MTHWNHRVVHAKDEQNGEDYLELAEVYYEDDGTPKMYGRPFLHGETLDNLKETAALLVAACEKPILERDDIVRPRRNPLKPFGAWGTCGSPNRLADKHTAWLVEQLEARDKKIKELELELEIAWAAALRIADNVLRAAMRNAKQLLNQAAQCHD